MFVIMYYIHFYMIDKTFSSLIRLQDSLIIEGFHIRRNV